MALTKEQKMDVALFRFSLIAPLLNNQVDEPNTYLEMISSKVHEVPHYGRKEYSAKTIRCWLNAYRQEGLDSLLPAVRKDKGVPRSIASALGERIIEMRKEHPEFSVQLFYDEMARHGVLLRRETSYHSVYRFLKKHGLHRASFETKAAQKDRKKFAYDEVNRLWQGDMMAGPYLYSEGRKKATYLFAFIDDCSRIIPFARFDTSQNFNTMKSVFIEALLRRGIPQVVYLDNAKVYRSKLFHPNKNQWWRLNKYWHEKNGKRWMFMTDEYSLINLRRIEIIRHPKLQISKNPFIHEEYFAKRKMKLKLLFAARNGEEMLEPYERETLTYGS